MLALATINVLLVEDNPGDVRLVREALADRWQVNLTVVENAIRALQVLSKTGEYIDTETPNLILLDMRLPIFDGTHVLEKISRTPEWQGIPVAVFTSSDHHRERSRCADLGAAGYYVKPSEWADWKTMVDSIFSTHVRSPWDLGGGGITEIDGGGRWPEE